MTIEELRKLVGKRGRVVSGKGAWEGEYVVVSYDPGRVVLDDLDGHKHSGPLLTVESVARRLQPPA